MTLATHGGTEFGWSYISPFKACPMRWFNTYHRPNSEGGVGLSPRKTAQPLLVGSGTHEGLAAWYRSGWRDGEDTGHRDIEAAIVAAEAHFATRRDEFEDSQVFDDSLATVHKLLTGYHDWYGPGDEFLAEFPYHRVVADPKTHEALVEVELRAELGNGHVFTARLDTVIETSGFIYALEHKTWAASGVKAGFGRFGIDGQATGQVFLLKHNYPEFPVAGVICNALVKNRGAKSQKAPFERNITGRTEQDIEKFVHDTRATLDEMESLLARYGNLVDSGMVSNDAANLVFDATPPSMVCYGFSRCAFYMPCKSRGYEQGLFDTNYRARPPRDVTDEESDDG